jgi:phage terminase small subunit
MKKLTPKQRRFIEEYLTDLNATKAAIRAGYSAKTAGQIGEKLLKKVEIAAAVAEAKKARSERTEITADRVLHELAAIAFLDPAKVFTSTGEVRLLDEMDESVRRAIASVETISLGDGGEAVSTVKKVKMNDKLRALELLGKHLQLWVERVKIGGDQENPLQVLLRQIQGTSLPLAPAQLPANSGYDDED